ncbi:MAG TPA: hypothetical protein VF395_02905 [Polyangiaceae bacterium]
MKIRSAGCALAAFVALSCGRASRAPAAPAPAGAPRAILRGGQNGEARVLGGPERCFNARDDDGNGLIDEGCGLRTGLVQFVIAWDARTADVDLLVTDPKGELSDVGRPTSSGLVKERDCPGRHDECAGKNYENVYLEKEEARRGTYKVSVRLERLEDEDVPIRVTLGARIGPKVYVAEVDLMSIEERADLKFEL